MDLYRYFHPHHNPRLRNVKLRHQELSELKQASTELSKAIKRAEIRTEEGQNIGPIKKEHISEVASAIDYVVENLGRITDAHPGDDLAALEDLIHERSEAPGWENWTRLLRQRTEMLKLNEDTADLKKKK